jgi:hypothetical protein
MIHELRMYQAVPGQMAKLQARFRDQLPPIWEKHGIRSMGYWTTVVGESSNRDGPIVANISNQILAPTAFSASK